MDHLNEIEVAQMLDDSAGWLVATMTHLHGERLLRHETVMAIYPLIRDDVMAAKPRPAFLRLFKEKMGMAERLQAWKEVKERGR